MPAAPSAGSPSQSGDPGRVLYRSSSGLQDILLTEDAGGSVSLTLDGFWQFHSGDEHIFHETLVDPAMVLAPEAARVLVLGGGDGLALRNVLRYPGVTKAVLCEIDPQVIEMTRTVPRMVELSEASLNDPRVTVTVRDALVLLEQATETFDVVICDFPSLTAPALEPLFSAAFFESLTRVTHDRSVISTQVSLDPRDFWTVLDAVAGSFSWVQPMLAHLGGAEDTWADFIVASPEPRAPARPLAPGLRFLTTQRLSSLVIRNRDTNRFDTDEYQGRPDFDEAP